MKFVYLLTLLAAVSAMQVHIKRNYVIIRSGPSVQYPTVRLGFLNQQLEVEEQPINGFYKTTSGEYVPVHACEKNVETQLSSSQSLSSESLSSMSIAAQKAVNETMKTALAKEEAEKVKAASKTADKDKSLESYPRPSTGQSVVYYSQLDERWRAAAYGGRGDVQTIGGTGCGPTTMAMVVAQWRDKTVTPLTLAKYAVEKGYRTVSSGTSYDFFTDVASKYRLNVVKTTSTDDVVKALKNGALVIASMGKGYWTNGGHYVLVHGVSGGVLYAHDPSSVVRTHATVDSFRKEANMYFIFTK